VQGHFTRIAVADPHETSRLLWRNLPAKETALLDEREVRSRLYEALDRRRFRLEPESFGGEFAIAHVGAVRTSRIVTSGATQFTIGVPGLDACCVSVAERGASRLTRPGAGEPAIADARGGLIFAGEPRTSYAAEGAASGSTSGLRRGSCASGWRFCWKGRRSKALASGRSSI
jgi:hypothetical protein